MATTDKVHMDPFPVGAVFFSAVNTNPSTLLGYGTWSLIGNGRMIMGAASTDKGLETGGSMSKSVPLLAHTHTGPSHTHSVPNHIHNFWHQHIGWDDIGDSFYIVNLNSGSQGWYTMATAKNQTLYHNTGTTSSGACTTGASGTGNTGSTGTANVTMDVTNSYIKLFIWQRTA